MVVELGAASSPKSPRVRTEILRLPGETLWFGGDRVDPPERWTDIRRFAFSLRSNLEAFVRPLFSEPHRHGHRSAAHL